MSTTLAANSPKLRSEIVPLSVTFAFAGAISMWTIGYVLRLPGIVAPGWMVGALLLVLHVAVCALAGREASRSRVLAGMLTGVILSAVNVLILLSVLMSEEDAQSGMTLALGLVGWIALGGLAGGISATFLQRRSQPSGEQSWPFVFALITLAGAFVLILAGGAVTSAEAGLAVPDWPSTFDTNMFLFPFSRMTGGIYLEHAHRLLGALVGLTTIVLMVMTLVMTPRWSMKAFSVVLLIWVSLQGIAGGLRVEEQNLVLALVHGVSAQLFVAALGAFAAMLSFRWIDRPVAPGATPKQLSMTRSLAWITFVVLTLQIGLGGAVRHFGIDSLHSLLTHIGWSLVAVVFVMITAFRLLAHSAGERLLRRVAKAPLHMLGLQMVLGGVALWAAAISQDAESPTRLDLIFTTSHQVVGAILLTLCLQMAIWSSRCRAGQGAAG